MYWSSSAVALISFSQAATSESLPFPASLEAMPSHQQRTTLQHKHRCAVSKHVSLHSFVIVTIRMQPLLLHRIVSASPHFIQRLD